MLDAIPLDDPRADDDTVVGAKAAGLARLVRAGFDVPAGVVLPAGLAAEWPSGPAPTWLSDIVAQACTALGGLLAVRSSATWEDSETSAHAGATLTVLGVDGVEAVLSAVRRCLDEGAEAQQAEGAEGDIAVLLQQMVSADHAGVAFTADPLTGERDIARIAATRGLGEALVQGEIVGSDVVVRNDQIEGDLVDLPAETALAVADVARRIEEAEGRPQDVEWAAVGVEVRVLQARPITILPTEPEPPQGNNWQKDIAHYPEPLTPFGWSAMHACGDQIREVFDECGLLIRGLEEVLVGGEVYGRVLPAMGSVDGTGKPPPAIVMGLAARIVPELRRRTARARRVLEDGVLDQWVHDWHAHDRDEMAARATDLGRVELADLDDNALGAHFDRCLKLARDGIRIHFRLAVALFHAQYTLNELVHRELGWDDAVIATMMAGHSPATRAGAESLASIRDRMAATPGAAEAMEADLHHPVVALAAVDSGLGQALAEWIDEHGWALVNYDAGVPVLAERPEVISTLVLSDSSPPDLAHGVELAAEAREALASDRQADFDAVLDKARAIYPIREDNTIIVGDRPLALLRRWMLEVGRRLAAAGAIPRPSDAPYLLIDEVRDALASGEGDGLTDRILRRRGEEAWARARPGPAYVGEQGDPPDISRLPDPLRRMNQPVLWAVGHEYPTPVDTPEGSDALLAGVAASPGVAEGPVRVIGGYDDMHHLRPGDVLVCQVTSPAWAPLFPLAAAVVADGGGALSHAAIASREHGLPAVLGTGSATSTLTEGQRVRVDGTRGLVYAAE